MVYKFGFTYYQLYAQFISDLYLVVSTAGAILKFGKLNCWETSFKEKNAVCSLKFNLFQTAKNVFIYLKISNKLYSYKKPIKNMFIQLSSQANKI